MGTNYQMLVNKNYGLDCRYLPENLIIPNVIYAVEKSDGTGIMLQIYEKKLEKGGDWMGVSGKKYMEKEAAKALERLFQKASQNEIYLAAISGFRSYERQTEIFYASVRKNGWEHARKYSAEPGFSEHQTGLAMDVSSKSVGYQLEEVFANSKEGKWLNKHCAEEGFILRYPKGKEKITGYAYEPWHFRYVGREAAKNIMDEGMVLEEWLALDCKCIG